VGLAADFGLEGLGLIFVPYVTATRPNPSIIRNPKSVPKALTPNRLSLNHALLLSAREAAGREASPSAGVIDSQSVKTTESGGPRGYDAGKKIKGRKRHILTDTEGNLVHAVIHTADIQDRDGAPLVLAEIIKRFPWLRHVFADGGYAGDKLRQALRRIGK